MVLIIAEAGVNHNGSDELALQLVEAAADAGADVVKFQTFRAKKLVTKSAQMADYQKANTGSDTSQFEMLSRLELSHDTHLKLLRRCNELGVEFLSTAFDEESLQFLVSEVGLKRLKLPSGEITNAPLVLAHAQTGLHIVVSTGMATLSEIELALGVIAYGYMLHSGLSMGRPCKAAFNEAYCSSDGRRLLEEKVTLLHCTTEYPAPLNEVNLRAMRTLNEAFSLPVGYSDHTQGIEIPVAATALGACIIEKHFTLNKSMEGPDHKASLEPSELKAMIEGIRNVTLAMGNGVKSPTLSEVRNKNIARKSLVASRSIAKGESFSYDNLVVMRPGSGMSPYEFWEVLGKPAPQVFAEGEIIYV